MKRNGTLEKPENQRTKGNPKRNNETCYYLQTLKGFFYSVVKR